MEIRDYWATIWKHKLVVVTCVVVMGLIGLYISYIYLKPVYEATAQILVDQPEQIVIMNDNGNQSNSQMSIETQKRLLKSRPVAERAAQILKRDSKQALALLNMIIATSDEDTGIIKVTVRDSNPQQCADISNAYAHAFEDVIKEFSRNTINDTIRFIDEQLEIAKATLSVKEKAIFDFTAKQGLIVLDEDIRRKNDYIASFESDKLENSLEEQQLQIQIDNLRSLMRDRRFSVSQNLENLDDNTALQMLKSQLFNFQVERAGLLTKYKPNHPLLRQIDGKMKKVEEKYERYANDVLNERMVTPTELKNERNLFSELQTKLMMIQSKRSNLESLIKNLKAEQLRVPEIKYQYNKLLREKEVADKLYMLLYEQHQQVMIDKVRRDVKVRVFDEATAPSEPISPNRKKNIMIALVLGIVIGIGAAFLLEEMEETVRTSDDVKNYLNLPVLGSIPYSAETINKLITDVPLKSPIAEAYRRLSFFTQLFCLDPPIKSLLVTSSKSDEGKSTTLANLAISMAQEGTKVLVIDTDLRRPMLHRMFGVDNSLGISSILTGELEAEIAVSDLSVSGRLPKESFMDIVVDRLIQPAGVKGLSIIPSGPLPANSIELLRSERMLAFMRCVEKKADIVIFDSPPSIHVIDAVVLAQILDGVLFVINSGRINRDEALQVKYMIESTKTPIIGVALNNIEVSSPDYYYYYYYGGYGYGSRQRRKRVKLKR